MTKNRFSIEIKVGIFVLVTAFALLLFIITQAKGGRRGGYEISAAFDYVSGLEVGSPVRVSGVRVGEVKGIEIVYDVVPKVLVKMKIRQDVKIAKYSRITIQTLGIIGEKYIEIAPSHNTEHVKPGELITGENPLSLERIADAGQSIVVRLNDILGDIRNITGEEDLQGNVRTFIKGSASAIESVDKAFEKIEKLSEEISDTNKKLQDLIVTQGPKLEELIENTNSLVVSGRSKMESTMDEIKALAVEGKKSGEMFTEVADTAKEFHAVASKMQFLIADTSRELTTTSSAIKEFFGKLQNEGLLAKIMKEEELVDTIKDEVLLLQDATRQFSTTAEQIGVFSVELNKLLSSINEGEGSLGKVLYSDELYREIMDFVRDIKENPWKILIRKRNISDEKR
ncbi:MAG TPA: MlaD family protein [bacterium]|nr:MlaD family protein [bacterium]